MYNDIEAYHLVLLPYRPYGTISDKGLFENNPIITHLNMRLWCNINWRTGHIPTLMQVFRFVCGYHEVICEHAERY